MLPNLNWNALYRIRCSALRGGHHNAGTTATVCCGLAEVGSSEVLAAREIAIREALIGKIALREIRIGKGLVWKVALREALIRRIAVLSGLGGRFGRRGLRKHRCWR